MYTLHGPGSACSCCQRRLLAYLYATCARSQVSWFASLIIVRFLMALMGLIGASYDGANALHLCTCVPPQAARAAEGADAPLTPRATAARSTD